MMREKFHRYSDMVPTELRMLVREAPNNYIDWGLIMYLFENTKSGNIVTLGKVSSFFDTDGSILFERLNKMNGLWVRQHLNNSVYGKIYYTYEITEIAADFIVKLIELLEITKKDKDN